MKPEAQRIAIAESVGWTFWWIDAGCYIGMLENDCFWDALDGNVGDLNRLLSNNEVPDYLYDLNAINIAEQKLIDGGLQDTWLDELVEVVVGKNVHWADYHCFPQVNRATAAQRAEAYLKTIGKWKP